MEGGVLALEHHPRDQRRLRLAGARMALQARFATRLRVCDARTRLC